MNAANEGLQGGGGVDALLHNLASGVADGSHDPARCPLCAECREKCPADAAGARLRTGAAVATAAHNVPGARFIMPDGLEVVFMGGVFVTSDAEIISQLEAICDRPTSQVYTSKSVVGAIAAEQKTAAADAAVGASAQA